MTKIYLSDERFGEYELLSRKHASHILHKLRKQYRAVKLSVTVYFKTLRKIVKTRESLYFIEYYLFSERFIFLNILRSFTLMSPVARSESNLI